MELKLTKDKVEALKQLKDLQKQIEKYNGSLKKLDLMSWSWSPSEVADDKPDS